MIRSAAIWALDYHIVFCIAPQTEISDSPSCKFLKCMVFPSLRSQLSALLPSNLIVSEDRQCIISSLSNKKVSEEQDCSRHH